MLPVSARVRHISVSKDSYVDFDDFEAFLNGALGIFVRTVATQMFPVSMRFRTPHFYPHTLCPIWTVDGSMVNAGSRFVVASSGVKHLSCNI